MSLIIFNKDNCVIILTLLIMEKKDFLAEKPFKNPGNELS